MVVCGTCKGVYSGRELHAIDSVNGQNICMECSTLKVLFEQTIRGKRLIRHQPLGDIYEITTETNNKMNEVVKKYSARK